MPFNNILHERSPFAVSVGIDKLYLLQMVLDQHLQKNHSYQSSPLGSDHCIIQADFDLLWQL